MNQEEIDKQWNERVTQCINACAGIEDPAAAIQAAREALYDLYCLGHHPRIRNAQIQPSTMSDTPETDEAMYVSIRYDGEEIPGFDYTDADFARSLERQRNMLLERLDTLTLVVGLTPIKGNLEALQEAMDQAREAIASVKQESPCVGKES